MFSSNTTQVSSDANFIEDVFSTWLYTGNGSTQTITNGIDLAGKGGFLWTKTRLSASSHNLFDSTRALNQTLSSNTTQAQQTINNVNPLTFNSNGFSLPNSSDVNANGDSYVSWTFRDQTKFFDVVTYTGDGNATQTISHNLGAAPGCIIVKRTNSTGSWFVYHRITGNDNVLFLNTTDAATASAGSWATSSTNFTVGNANLNIGGATYVAYLFAHNAGGFGLTGLDNVITCESFTGDGSGNATVNLGYEPQWVLWKRTSATGDWGIIDNMRGMTVNQNNPYLRPNTTNGEASIANFISPNATGFTATGFGAGSVNIYIAIRRGPMRTPTTGTNVFSPNAVTMSGSGSATITTNFPVDLSFNRRRSAADQYVMDRLRGGTSTSYNFLVTQTTAAESTGSGVGVAFDSNTGLVDNNWQSGVSANTIWWSFRRAPGFFDEVCYTGSGSARTLNHNLGVAPELMIVKDRSSTSGWSVYAQPLGATNAMVLQTTAAVDTGTSRWNSTTPTSTVFSLGNSGFVNSNTQTYVAYLFASLPGISKVGSYTGNATTQTINCGFTAGCRFILIKRTDGLGDWYVWDSARGIVSGNDPYLLLNSTAAEVTNTDWVDTVASGFELTNTAPAALNALGGNYIFLAIA